MGKQLDQNNERQSLYLFLFPAILFLGYRA